MRLLIAEDNDRLRKSLVHIFEKNYYAVDAVSNGSDALSYALSSRYDAYIFDIMMPERDGLSVLRELRGRGDVCPALFLTAKTEVSQRIAGLDAGADDYLSKPFSVDELLARVRALLRRRCSFTPDVIRYGDLLFDRAAYEISRIPDGESDPESVTALSRKEFQILEALLLHPKTFISTQQLIDRAWEDGGADISSLWVHMSNLRKKLDQLHTRVQIRFVKGVGYSLSLQGE